MITSDSHMLLKSLQPTSSRQQPVNTNGNIGNQQEITENERAATIMKPLVEKDYITLPLAEYA